MKNLLLHLRINISIVLAPIFLWGLYLSGGSINYKFWIGFIAFHIFLYGGSNAYNSFYDKDEGPIGGLKNPPKVTQSLLYFSLSVKIIGLLMSWFVNIPFFITYIVFFILSVIYSHPLTRWKANPNLGILTVGLGQGGLAFISGWLCYKTTFDPLSIFFFGMFTTIFMSLGVYPLTQLYQVEEDRKRNDITFAVRWGIKNSFRFSNICVLLSSLSILSVLYIKKSYIELGIVAVFYLFFLGQIYNWSKKYDEKDILANYDKIMKLNYLNGLGFMVYICLHILYLI